MLGGLRLAEQKECKIKRIITSIFALITITFIYGNEIVLSDELRLHYINDKIIIVTHSYPWESNSLILITDKSNVILIDTPYTNEAMEKVLKWIIKEYKPKKIEAVITGYHVDNIGGLGFLIKNDIEVLGGELTNNLVRSDSIKTIKKLMSLLNRNTQRKYYDYYSNIVLVGSTKEIKLQDSYVYKMDNLSIELFYPGESHAKDNITVYISNYNVLFGSCIIKAKESNNLGFTGDANIANWPIAVRKIKDRYLNCEIVIPHHGKYGGFELLDHTLKLFNK
jgi:metallo-beta-lactamase class B